MANDTLARVLPSVSLSANSPETLRALDEAAAIIARRQQLEAVTEHLIHGGMYARTMRLPEGAVIVGALIRVPTILVIQGSASLLAGDDWAHIDGYGVLAGSAYRKALIVARGPVEMTMLFPTQARTVEEAERELTDEHEKLMSRRSESNATVVTGE